VTDPVGKWPEDDNFEAFREWMLSGGRPSDADAVRTEQIARDRGWLTNEGWVWEVEAEDRDRARDSGLPGIWRLLQRGAGSTQRRSAGLPQ
jgi:hypothetical protein